LEPRDNTDQLFELFVPSRQLLELLAVGYDRLIRQLLENRLALTLPGSQAVRIH
jgi:hypothetical protein